MKTLVVACIALSLFVCVALCHKPNKRSPKETNPSKRDIYSRLRSRSMSPVKRALLDVAKRHLSLKRTADSDITEEEIEELREEFEEFDENDDEVLTKTELRVMFEPEIEERIEADFQAEIKKMDTNGDGTVDFDEFLSAMTGDTDDTVRDWDFLAFCNFLDENDNGVVSALELKNGIVDDGTLSDEEVNEYIKDADQDDDGEMDCNEFVEKMTSD